MLILSVDSSGMTAAAALVTEEKILAEMSVNNKKTHSQTLLPMIEQLLDNAQVAPEDLDAIAIAEGPGSFTGLRIGAALAKGFGLALDRPVIGVSTMDAMAYGLGVSEHFLCPMIDARHETVYTGLYTWQDGEFETLIDTEAVSLEELAGQIAALENPAGSIVISGDGADVYSEAFDRYLTVVYQQPEHAGKTKPSVMRAPVHLRMQRAAAVGALALKKMQAGGAVNADEFVPDYHRMTQAERMKKLRENR